MFDIHTHSHFSMDGSLPVAQLAADAHAEGIKVLTVTDHLDFDYTTPNLADMHGLAREVESVRASFPDMKLLWGAEMGLDTIGAPLAALDYLSDCSPDVIIGSVHTVYGVDSYYPEFFEGKTQKQAYRDYLEMLVKDVEAFHDFDTFGHYDFVAKHAPYADRTMTVDYGRELIDELTGLLAKLGKPMEINSAVWKDGPEWGLDVLTRFREQGGEFFTFASDAHKQGKAGKRWRDAFRLAEAAGLYHVVYFEQRKPIITDIRTLSY